MMKRISTTRCWRWLAAVACIMVIGCQGPAGAQDDGIPWKTHDEALREAKEMARPVYLYFFMDNCMYCNKMDTQTFTDKAVADYLRVNFVSARIHYNTEPHLVKKYVVRGFPTSWFLSPEGETISYLPGYVGPEYFVRMLKYVGEGYFKTQSLREYLRGS